MIKKYTHTIIFGILSIVSIILHFNIHDNYICKELLYGVVRHCVDVALFTKLSFSIFPLIFGFSVLAHSNSNLNSKLWINRTSYYLWFYFVVLFLLPGEFSIGTFELDRVYFVVAFCLMYFLFSIQVLFGVDYLNFPSRDFIEKYKKNRNRVNYSTLMGVLSLTSVLLYISAPYRFICELLKLLYFFCPEIYKYIINGYLYLKFSFLIFPLIFIFTLLSFNPKVNFELWKKRTNIFIIIHFVILFLLPYREVSSQETLKNILYYMAIVCCIYIPIGTIWLHAKKR